MNVGVVLLAETGRETSVFDIHRLRNEHIREKQSLSIHRKRAREREIERERDKEKESEQGLSIFETYTSRSTF